jgi:hypothetical protein
MLGKALPLNIGELLPNLIQLTNGSMFESPIPPSLSRQCSWDDQEWEFLTALKKLYISRKIVACLQ